MSVESDVRRVLRIVDGDASHEGISVRIDRLETRGARNAERIAQLEASMPDSDNPLLTMDAARRVFSHVQAAEDHAVTQRAVFGFAARELFTWSLQLASVIVLGYLALHGVPLAH